MYRKLIEMAGVSTTFGLAGLCLAHIVRDWPTPIVQSVAFISAGLTAAVVWRLAVLKRTSVSWWIGGLWGAGIGLLSHPVFLYLLCVTFWTMQQTGLMQVGPSGPAFDPLNALWASALASIISVLLFGIPTALLGSLTGAGAVLIRDCLQISEY